MQKTSNDPSPPVCAIIMAAGKGARMKSDRPKVLHEINGQPLLHYVLEACKDSGCIDRYVVVVGFAREQVKAAFAHWGKIEWAVQDEQLGTGHAVLCARNVLENFSGTVVVLNGDFPFLRPGTIKRLVTAHHASNADATTIVAKPPNPTGCGRIIRNNDRLVDIVEEPDLAPDQKKIPEVFAGITCAAADALFGAIEKVKNNNKQKEYYLPDALKIMASNSAPVGLIEDHEVVDLLGVNNQDELSKGIVYLGEKT